MLLAEITLFEWALINYAEAFGLQFSHSQILNLLSVKSQLQHTCDFFFFLDHPNRLNKYGDYA